MVPTTERMRSAEAVCCPAVSPVHREAGEERHVYVDLEGAPACGRAATGSAATATWQPGNAACHAFTATTKTA